MTRSTLHFLAATLLAAALPGCAALETRRLAASDLSEIDGLAVNQNVPYGLVALFPEAPGSTAIAREAATVMLPSPQELYVVDYTGALFTSRVLEVELYPDTTVKRVKMSTDPQVDEAIAEFTETAKQAGELRTALQEPPALKEENAKVQLELENAILKANLDAAKAGAELPYPPSK